MRTLSITTTRPIIQAETTRAQVDIQSKRRSFTVKRTPTRMNVVNKRPVMRVNWGKIRSEMGLRSPDYFRTYMHSLNKQKTLDGIARIASNGARIGAVNQYAGSGTDPIGMLAWDEMNRNNQVQVNVGSMPQSLPEVSWDEGSTTIDWEIGDLEITWDPEFMPEFTVTPFSIEIRLSGHPSVQISVNEDRIAEALGKNVDEDV